MIMPVRVKRCQAVRSALRAIGDRGARTKLTASGGISAFSRSPIHIQWDAVRNAVGDRNDKALTVDVC
jgi:hypothetical protein